MFFNKRNLTKNTFTNTFFKNTFSVQAQTRLLSHQEALIKEQIGLLRELLTVSAKWNKKIYAKTYIVLLKIQALVIKKVFM